MSMREKGPPLKGTANPYSTQPVYIDRDLLLVATDSYHRRYTYSALPYVCAANPTRIRIRTCEHSFLCNSRDCIELLTSVI